jgi:hypothetical protein
MEYTDTDIFLLQLASRDNLLDYLQEMRKESQENMTYNYV